MKFNTHIIAPVILALLFLPSLAADVNVSLDSNNGSSSFTVKNSSSTVETTIDSLGSMTVTGGIIGNNGNTAGIGCYITSTSTSGYGIYARNFNNIGIWGRGGSCGATFEAANMNGIGAYAFATLAGGTGVSGRGAQCGGSFEAVSGSGRPTAVTGKTNSATGYAFYGLGGRNYFQGNVGIGSSEPGAPLTVDNSAQAYINVLSRSNTNGSVLQLTNTTAGTSTYLGAINFVDNAGNYKGQIGYRGTDALSFRTNGVDDRMRIMANGNVGIGTSNPTSSLEVVGDGYFNGNLSVNGAQAWFYNMPNLSAPGDIACLSGNGRLYRSSSPYLSIYGGKIGIGITNPTTTLSVNGTGYYSSDLDVSGNLDVDGAQVWLTDLPSLSQAGNILVASANGRLYQSTTPYIYVNSSGHLGIGTTTPGSLLEVNGAADFDSTLNVDGNATVNGNLEVWGSQAWFYGSPYVSSGGDIAVLSGNGRLIRCSAPYITVLNSHVGIGTTNPAYLLQVGNSGDGTSARANAWNTFSDLRLKTNLVKISDALEKVKQLNGYYFNWKNGRDKSAHVGVIAQEVEKVLPQDVSEDESGYKSVDYGHLTPLLIEALKEQQIIIDKQKDRIDQLESRLKLIEGKLGKTGR